MRPPSRYRRLAVREAYRNPWVVVEVHDVIHPTGDDFVLARQPRFAADAAVLEIVKGGAGEGETALACAQRELREELGLEAQLWTPLGHVHEIPSIVEHPVTLFLARDLRSVESAQEHVEAIVGERIAIDDAYRAAVDGRIDDAVTIAALLRFRMLEG
jgi:8-oxo-dGTP pyrophosphatase MutT (NUDIX family)